MTYQLSIAPAARTDIINTLSWSTQSFGVEVGEGYQALIVAALDLIRKDPAVLGSRERADLAAGLRTLHLRACRNRVTPAVRRIASPRHFMVYRQNGQTVQVVRLLHDSMDVMAIKFTS